MSNRAAAVLEERGVYIIQLVSLLGMRIAEMPRLKTWILKEELRCI